ncbi:MAG: emp24/gp25L/p24 family protein [Chloroflexi bacterium]|nr:emp24/gp25L/p24 family protein [Chloroflexota bacterium]
MKIRFLILICLALIPLATACALAPGGVDSTKFIETGFTVEPGQKHTIAVSLQERQAVEGTLSVSGAENTIDFYILGPDRELVYGVVRVVGGHSFKVPAQKTGTYTLYFDNSFSFGRSRQVALRYRAG